MNCLSERNYSESGFAGFVDLTWKFEQRPKRFTLFHPTLQLILSQKFVGL